MNESKKDGDKDDYDEMVSEGRKKTGTKLCARGKAAAKSKYDVYPSAYANGYAVQVCKGEKPGLDGKKHHQMDTNFVSRQRLGWDLYPKNSTEENRVPKKRTCKCQ